MRRSSEQQRRSGTATEESVGPPLSKKYADDVADIVYCIKNCQNLPRVLLKNGKRSAAARRPSVSATPPSPPVLSSAAAEQAAGTQLRDQYGCNGDCALLQSDITNLKKEVADIQHELMSLKCKSTQCATTDSCLLFVK